MSYIQGSYPVIEKARLTQDIYQIRLNCPEIASQTAAGQFVHLRAEGYALRRPISVCDFDKESVRLVFQVRGGGTEALSHMEAGDKMDLIGPLGNGYPPLSPGARVILVGGGIGVPPLLGAARQYGGRATALLGFRNRDACILTEDFERSCALQVATDDGSAGHHGLVTDLLQKALAEGRGDVVFACGPTVMLKGVVELAQRYGVPAKVSVEERMACGVGACLVCACRTVRDGKEIFSRVCADGPVFDGEEVVFS